MTIKKQISHSKTRGFTLVEIVVAIGLVALLLSAVLGLMGVSALQIDKALSKKEGQRLVAAVVAEFNNVNGVSVSATGIEAPAEGEIARLKFSTPLQKVAVWKEGSNEAGEAIIVYNYAAIVDPAAESMDDQLRDDRTFPPFDLSDASAVAGIHYQVIPVVRRLSDGTDTTGYFEDASIDYKSIVGDVYLVKMREYEDSTGLVLGDETTYGEIISDVTAVTYEVASDSDGVAELQVELYKLPTNGNGSPGELISYLTNNIDKFQDITGQIRPVYKENVGVGIFEQ